MPNVTQLDALEEDMVINLSQCFQVNDYAHFEDHVPVPLISPQKEDKFEGEKSLDRGQLTGELHSHLPRPTGEDRQTRFAVS